MGCFCSKENEFPRRSHRQEAYCFPTTTPASTYNREDTTNNRQRHLPSRLNIQDAYRNPAIVSASTYNRDNTAYNTQRNQQNFYRPHQQPKETADPKPKIGEYKCGACGRFWTSRYSWSNKYQKCKRCKRPVYAHAQRELKPSDNVKDNDDKHPHEMELCQMCQQLGHSCTTKSNKRKKAQ